jgi:hypothetical protein
MLQLSHPKPQQKVASKMEIATETEKVFAMFVNV